MKRALNLDFGQFAALQPNLHTFDQLSVFVTKTGLEGKDHKTCSLQNDGNLLFFVGIDPALPTRKFHDNEYVAAVSFIDCYTSSHFLHNFEHDFIVTLRNSEMKHPIFDQSSCIMLT